MHYSSMDIFCHVIDNFGDAGVVYRFAKQWRIAAPECRLRVFIDDIAALAQLAPAIDTNLLEQVSEGISWYRWDCISSDLIDRIGTADVLVEAFACYIPEVVLEAASLRPTVIINLEYFSAESWIEGYHRKESLMGRGGLRKYFFMPGITADSGGLIIGKHIEETLKRSEDQNIEFVNSIAMPYLQTPIIRAESIIGSIFTYTRGFDTLIQDAQSLSKQVYLFVFGNKSHEGMRKTLHRMTGGPIQGASARIGRISVLFMPFLTQDHYDELLCAADFNIVRGEDSFARAIISGKPLLWQAYIQEKKYQLVKVRAFADALGGYFDDTEVAARFRDIILKFNDLEQEEPYQTTQERYGRFFEDLNKIGHATRKMSYFIRENCNLVKNLSVFLNQV